MTDTLSDPELEKLRARISDTSMLLGSQRRKQAAERLAALGTPAAARVLAEAFIESADRRIAEIARQTLTRLSDQAAIDAVCDLLITTGDEGLSALITQAGHMPSDPGRRAVFLFLTGEFERYAELDFDGSLLRAAHDAADKGLRRRLAAKARVTGRVEWVRSVVDGQRHRIAELSDGEWETVVGVLVSAARWEELWRLAVEAPPLWGVRMLQALDEHGWKPASEAEQADYAELIALAVACSEIPTEHTPGKAIVLRGHSEIIEHLAITPDSGLLASGSRDNTVRLWRLPLGTPAGVLNGHGDWITCLAVTPGRGDSSSAARAATTARCGYGDCRRVPQLAPSQPTRARWTVWQ